MVKLASRFNLNITFELFQHSRVVLKILVAYPKLGNWSKSSDPPLLKMIIR